jgi:ABC-type multidrug transport system ATPase subunit
VAAITSGDVADRMTSLVGERLRIERGGTVAVEGVDLAIDAGCWLGVIGANGSGKTSLLRALAGRLPIAAGRLVIDGCDVAGDRAARAKRIGFAPPIEMLPAALRVRDVLALAGGDLATALDRLGPLRDALAIDGLVSRVIGTCSAGMRQRITIACAFADGRDAVVLDEPFNWLDPVAAYDVRMALRIMVDEGMVLMTALHDLATMVASCDQGLLLSAGRVALAIDETALAAARHDPAVFERRMIAALRAGPA